MNKMSDDLKKFIDEKFDALRRDVSKAFEVARQRIQAAEEASNSDQQQKTV
jgi:hypothetical protein